jgi:hypothetical protein
LALRFQISCVVGVFALALAPGARATLFHDSFSTTYRSPGGAVPTGTNVRLRLRVTGERVGEVALRLEVGDPVTDTSTLRTLKLKRAGAFWSVVYRSPAKPALVSYSFRVTTSHGCAGTATTTAATTRARAARAKPRGLAATRSG